MCILFVFHVAAAFILVLANTSSALQFSFQQGMPLQKHQGSAQRKAPVTTRIVVNLVTTLSLPHSVLAIQLPKDNQFEILHPSLVISNFFSDPFNVLALAGSISFILSVISHPETKNQSHPETENQSHPETENQSHPSEATLVELPGKPRAGYSTLFDRNDGTLFIDDEQAIGCAFFSEKEQSSSDSASTDQNT